MADFNRFIFEKPSNKQNVFEHDSFKVLGMDK